MLNLQNQLQNLHEELFYYTAVEKLRRMFILR